MCFIYQTKINTKHPAATFQRMSVYKKKWILFYRQIFFKTGEEETDKGNPEMFTDFTEQIILYDI